MIQLLDVLIQTAFRDRQLVRDLIQAMNQTQLLQNMVQVILESEEIGFIKLGYLCCIGRLYLCDEETMVVVMGDEGYARLVGGFWVDKVC